MESAAFWRGMQGGCCAESVWIVTVPDATAAEQPRPGTLQQHPIHVLAAVESAPPTEVFVPLRAAAPHCTQGGSSYRCISYPNPVLATLACIEPA